MRHHKEVWKQKFNLIFSLRPFFLLGREGLMSRNFEETLPTQINKHFLQYHRPERKRETFSNLKLVDPSLVPRKPLLRFTKFEHKKEPDRRHQQAIKLLFNDNFLLHTENAFWKFRWNWSNIRQNYLRIQNMWLPH